MAVLLRELGEDRPSSERSEGSGPPTGERGSHEILIGKTNGKPIKNHWLAPIMATGKPRNIAWLRMNCRAKVRPSLPGLEASGHPDMTGLWELEVANMKP